MIAQWVGIVGGLGTTCSFLPQVYTICKSTSTNGLSISMMFLQLGGTASWVVYGYLRKDYIVIGFNAISVTLVSSIILKYFMFSKSSLHNRSAHCAAPCTVIEQE
jgi:MtN3 and saliva related transmembrane protein